MTTKRLKPRAAKPDKPEPACQIVLTSAAPDAPWEWNVKGYALFDAIALTSLMLDQMKSLAFQRMGEKAKEESNG